MTAETTQRCCNCEFGKRVRMDINYKYPIQYICKLTGDRVYTRCYDDPSPEWCPYRVIVAAMSDKELTANEEWRHKRLDIAVKSKEKFKRELIAENERLSERLNELQTLFPLRQIPEPTNNVGADEWRDKV